MSGRPALDADLGAFDAIVVGGGINGTAIARDAALRGLRILLLEKDDFSAHTSAWSSRNIHGGLRYLEYAEIGLVRESLREREWLLRAAPHLVHPVPWTIPFYRHNHRGALLMRAGMLAYDLLSYDKSVPRYRIFDRKGMLAYQPGLDPSDLQGGAVYYDAQVRNAERLSVENALSARAHGAVILNHARVDRLIRQGDTVVGVEFTDTLRGDRHVAHARLTVNVAGAWVDRVLGDVANGALPLVGPTKGTHLVVEPFPGAPTGALYYEARADGRPVMILEWGKKYLIGSTDIRVDENLDAPRAEAEEIDYLLREANGVIPSARLTEAAILYTYTGVRPLAYVRAGATAAITRRHIIHDHAPATRGLISIVGGKLTTFRSLAEQAVDRMTARLGVGRRPCLTRVEALPGAETSDFAAFAADFKAGTPLSGATADRLLGLYGTRSGKVVDLIQLDPDLAEVFDSESGAIGAELVFAFQEEMAETLVDALFRRTMVGLDADLGFGALPVAGRIVGRYLGWDQARLAQELADYRAYTLRFRPLISHVASSEPVAVPA